MPKKFVGEIFCFSRISGVEKFLCISGVCHDFLPAVFCRTVPKTFLTEPFCVSDFLRYRKKFVDKKGGLGGVSRFSF